jgi:hypothetical protein
VASDVPASAVVDAVEELRRLSRGGWVWGKSIGGKVVNI